MTQANEPVTEDLIQRVWAGRSVEDEPSGQQRDLLKLVKTMPQLKEDEKLKVLLSRLPPEVRERLENPSETPDVRRTASPVVPVRSKGAKY